MDRLIVLINEIQIVYVPVTSIKVFNRNSKDLAAASGFPTIFACNAITICFSFWLSCISSTSSGGFVVGGDGF
jgi:hypothetical protein